MNILTDVLFADPLLSRTVTYAGTGFTREIPTLYSQTPTALQFGQSSIASSAHTFKVRVEDVSLPVAGDTITMGGRTFTVTGEPQLILDGQVWLVGAVP